MSADLPERPQDPEGGDYGVDEALWAAAGKGCADARKQIAEAVMAWHAARGEKRVIFWMKAKPGWVDRASGNTEVKEGNE